MFNEKFNTKPKPENQDLKKQLLNLLEQYLKPQELNNYKEQIQAENKLEQKENFIADQDINEVLEKYNINPEKIRPREDGFYEITVNKHFNKNPENKLPEGYGYKGGAARSLLLINLGIDTNSTPRDIDIIRLDEQEPYEGADDELAQKYMPDDFKYGNRVEVIDNLEKYFSNRDFTMNEILATDEKIILNKQCLLDSIRHIIRLSEEYKEEARAYGAPRWGFLAKAMRFYSEAIHRYGYAEIDLLEDYEIEETSIKPFWLALHLDRACNINKLVAQNYVQEMIKNDQIPPEIDTVAKAADYLLNYVENFYYRYAPSQQFKIEDEWTEDLYKLSQLPKQKGHGRGK